METGEFAITDSIPADLETFLGGMETRLGDGYRRGHCGLETFLGGMETAFCRPLQGEQRAALKPSLVEWKLSIAETVELTAEHLETFLGGMETVEIRQPEGDVVLALKPSLVEWKHELNLTLDLQSKRNSRG